MYRSASSSFAPGLHFPSSTSRLISTLIIWSDNLEHFFAHLTFQGESKREELVSKSLRVSKSDSNRCACPILFLLTQVLQTIGLSLLTWWCHRSAAPEEENPSCCFPRSLSPLSFLHTHSLALTLTAPLYGCLLYNSAFFPSFPLLLISPSLVCKLFLLRWKCTKHLLNNKNNQKEKLVPNDEISSLVP